MNPKYESMDIYTAPGRVVRFMEKQSIEQIRWGGNDSPNDLLVVGEEYLVDHTEVHSQHTKLHLVAFPGKRFNTVTFANA